MTDELSPATRALLDEARAGLGPDAVAIARMRAKIDATVAAAGGAAATTGLAASTLTKLGLVGLVAVVVGGAVVYSRHDSAPARRVASAAPRASELQPAVDVVVPPVAPALVEPTLAPPTVTPEPPSPEIEMPAAVVAKRPVRAAAPTVDLAREVALVDAAMAAMKRGDADGALVVIRDYTRETAGKGQLAEDAAAIEIEARCKLSRPVAVQLAAFDARWPTSAQRSRLTAACSVQEIP